MSPTQSQMNTDLGRVKQNETYSVIGNVQSTKNVRGNPQFDATDNTSGEQIV